MGNHFAYFTLLLGKKYGISSSSDWQYRKKLASLNDRIYKRINSSIDTTIYQKWNRGLFSLQCSLQDSKLGTSSVVCVGCLQKLVQTVCCYLVHLSYPRDPRSFQKWICCPRGCYPCLHNGPCPTTVFEYSSNWFQCRHFCMQASEHYKKLILKIDFKLVTLDLLG